METDENTEKKKKKEPALQTRENESVLSQAKSGFAQHFSTVKQNASKQIKSLQEKFPITITLGKSQKADTRHARSQPAEKENNGGVSSSYSTRETTLTEPCNTGALSSQSASPRPYRDLVPERRQPYVKDSAISTTSYETPTIHRPNRAQTAPEAWELQTNRSVTALEMSEFFLSSRAAELCDRDNRILKSVQLMTDTSGTGKHYQPPYIPGQSSAFESGNDFTEMEPLYKLYPVLSQEEKRADTLSSEFTAGADFAQLSQQSSQDNSLIGRSSSGGLHIPSVQVDTAFMDIELKSQFAPFDVRQTYGSTSMVKDDITKIGIKNNHDVHTISTYQVFTGNERSNMPYYNSQNVSESLVPTDIPVIRPSRQAPARPAVHELTPELLPQHSAPSQSSRSLRSYRPVLPAKYSLSMRPAPPSVLLQGYQAGYPSFSQHPLNAQTLNAAAAVHRQEETSNPSLSRKFSHTLADPHSRLKRSLDNVSSYVKFRSGQIKEDISRKMSTSASHTSEPKSHSRVYEEDSISNNPNGQGPVDTCVQHMSTQLSTCALLVGVTCYLLLFAILISYFMASTGQR